jgi:DNA-binding protein H-NS
MIKALSPLIRILFMLRSRKKQQNRRKAEMSETCAPTDTDGLPAQQPAPRIPDFEQMSEAETMTFVDAFLDRLSLEGIATVIAAAETKHKEKQDEVRITLLQEFRERAAAIGMRVSLEPLTAPSQTRKTRVDAGAPLPAKYRGPNGETWSGRGIAPRWLKAFELEGRSREEFRVGADT